MKRILFSLLFIFSMIGLAHAINPANLIIASVESKYLGKNNDTIPEFKLGHVNFITDNSGSTEYKNGWIRNTIEWCLYRSYNNGTLLVKADPGYWIKDVTFHYSDCNSYGMLADTVGAGQKKIAAYDSAKAIVINGPEKQFYVGKTKTGNGGYLSITQFAVSYYKTPDSLALEDRTVLLGETYQLTPQTFPAGSDTIYAWSSDNSKVVSIDQYGVFTAKAVGEANISVSAGHVSATCKITVLDCSDQGVLETFSNCQVEKRHTGTTSVVGDHNRFLWKITNYQRVLAGTEDKVNGSQGIRVRYSGSIAMDSIQDGGIKAIAFDWRTPNSVNIINYSVNVGDQRYEYNSSSIPTTTVSHFSRQFNVKENTTFSFDMAPKIGQDGQCYVIVGPITIIPYLLFTPTNHREIISIADSGTYNLNNVLINNTGEMPQFSVTRNTTGATTDIVDGVLSIHGKTQPGEITILASWNEDKVTTTMTLYVDDLPSGSSFTETFSNCYTTQMFDGRVHVIGDQGIYDWSIKNFQRTPDADTILQQQGVRIRYNGSIMSSGAQEGGVRDLDFDWRATGVGMPAHFLVQVGDSTCEYSSPTTVSQTMHYHYPCRMPVNALIKVSVPAEEKPAQTYIVVGPLSITPYLLFMVPEHMDTILLADTTYYDLRNVLIDNTEGKGAIVYSIEADETSAAVLNGSVVDLSAVRQSGRIDLKAAWGDVFTTMSLWADANTPSSLHHTPYTLHPTPYTKVLTNGQFLILRDGKTYNAQGQLIE